MFVNDRRVNDLLDQFFNGSLTGDDRASLEQTLLATPQARELFWRKADIHTDLRHWGVSTWDRLPIVQARMSRRGGGLSWLTRMRSLAAAAVLLALAMGSALGAGIAWALVPHFRGAMQTIVGLANGGFEDGDGASAILSVSATQHAGLPADFGRWTADRVRITGAENGVAPFEGERMLAFEEALPGPGDAASLHADSCNLFQVIDLRPYHDQIANGDCGLTLSARVLDARENTNDLTAFFARITVFDGDPKIMLAGWPQVRFDALAVGGDSVRSHGGQAVSWAPLSAKVVVPKGATFAVVQIDATNRDRSGSRTAATFDRQYCDDVRLGLGAVSFPTASSP